MTDRNNLEYDTLIEIQEKDLKIWAKRLRSEIYSAMVQYVRRNNEQARTANDKHQVWRGQDLVEVIMAWPYTAPGFPAVNPPKVGADMI